MNLQVVYFWARHPMGYRLLRRGEGVSVGPTKHATFVAPQVPGLPTRLRILSPTRTGYRLRVWPGMTGQLQIQNHPREVAGVLALPPPRRRFGGPPVYREIDIAPGDVGNLAFDAAGALTMRFNYVEPPEVIPRPRVRDGGLFPKIAGVTGASTLSALLAVLYLGSRVPDETIAITPERFARIVAPVLQAPPPRVPDEIAKVIAAEEARKRKEREAAEAKRMKDAEGKLGRADAPARDTVLPKGRQDILREKVAKTPLLAALGNAKAQGSGLGKLLTQETTDYDQALNGLEGAKLVAGRGAGGLGNAGTGLGGGGTGFGRIAGSGDLNVGTSKYRGRKGPGLGPGKEKEVSVGLETGTPDAEGGLTKEQINRVVRAHAAAVKYCYEKELQRAPELSGKIALYWVIRPNGDVDRVRTATSSMSNRNVEGCIERQVKNWQFPRSDAETIVQSYPFLFKGGT